MAANNQKGSRKADRVRLILELRQAYRRFADLLQQYRHGSPKTPDALVQATRRLSAMNRALALVAVESTRRANSRNSHA